MMDISSDPLKQQISMPLPLYIFRRVAGGLMLAFFLVVMALALGGCQKGGREIQPPPNFRPPGSSGAQSSASTLPPLVCGIKEGCPPAVGEMISNRINGTAFCTVTLISPRLVLTASHCIGWENVDSANRFKGGCWVRWPSSHRKAQSEMIPCEAVHEATRLSRANEDRVQLDFAFIRLAQPVARTPMLLAPSSKKFREQKRQVELYGTQLKHDQHIIRRLRCLNDDSLRLQNRSSDPRDAVMLGSCPAQVGFSGGPIIAPNSGLIIGVQSFIEERYAVGTRPALREQ